MNGKTKIFGSSIFKFNMVDLIGVLKMALMVGAASVLTFFVDNIGNIEMGQSLLIVIPIVTTGLNAVIKWLKNNTYEVDSKDVESNLTQN